MRKKIKQGDILEYKGMKVILRNDCPSDTLYFINDKTIGDEIENQMRLNQICDIQEALKKTKRYVRKIYNLK